VETAEVEEAVVDIKTMMVNKIKKAEIKIDHTEEIEEEVVEAVVAEAAIEAVTEVIAVAVEVVAEVAMIDHLGRESKLTPILTIGNFT
jgi:F0F1-type ATP synthase membrane subunit b/b'